MTYVIRVLAHAHTSEPSYKERNHTIFETRHKQLPLLTSNLLFKPHINLPYQPHIYNMSGQSNVGNSQVYEAADQVTRSNAEIEQEKKEARFHEGKENSHKAQDSSTLLLLVPCLHDHVAESNDPAPLDLDKKHVLTMRNRG